MKNEDVLIKVDNGDTFEGNLNHWQDCFFSFPDGFTWTEKKKQIEDFCERQKFGLTIQTRLKLVTSQHNQKLESNQC